MRMREADGLANERLVSFPSARPGLGNPGTLPYVHGTGTANGTVKGAVYFGVWWGCRLWVRG